MTISKRIELLERSIPDEQMKVYTYFYTDDEPKPEPVEDGDNIMNVYVNFISSKRNKQSIANEGQ